MEMFSLEQKIVYLSAKYNCIRTNGIFCICQEKKLLLFHSVERNLKGILFLEFQFEEAKSNNW